MGFNLSDWVSVDTFVFKLVDWLIDKGLRDRQKDYLTITFSRGRMKFKGSVSTTSSAEEILEELLVPVKKGQKREDKPKLIDSVEVEQKREGKSSK